MTQLSNATLTTLQTTYLDDYSEDKKFYRMLFRPSVAVQARELTQLQTILQNQIQRFGDHIVRDGSVIDGVAVNYNTKFPYVILRDTFNANTAMSVTTIDPSYLVTNGTDSAKSVRAVVRVAKAGFLSTYSTTQGELGSNRFYLNYIRTGKDGSNNDVTEFSSGDTLYIYNSDQSRLDTLSSTNLFDTINMITDGTTYNGLSSVSKGYGYGVTISDGQIYQKGFFLKVDSQTLIVKDYDRDPTGYAVGFDTSESIVTENQDPSLYDNAAGFSNYNAPGAHRLKLTPVLVSKLKTSITENSQFFSIIEFDNGSPSQQKTDPVYTKLGEEFARRTYEESGDYIIKPFNVETLTNADDATTFDYQVSPGIAYVKGSRVEFIGARKVNAPRAITTDSANNQTVTLSYGNYVYCSELAGTPNISALTRVGIYDAPLRAISTFNGNLTAPSSSLIGYANIKSINWNSGNKGTGSCIYYVYLTNIVMNSGKSFSRDAKSFYVSDTTYGKFKADIILENQLAVLKDTTKSSLFYNAGYKFLKRFKDSAGVNRTSFEYRQITSGSLSNSAASATFTLSGTPAPGGTETNYYSGTPISDALETEYDIIFAANVYTIPLGASSNGHLTVTSGSRNITGDANTRFLTEFSNGSIIRVGAAGAAYYTVNNVISDTSLYVVETPNAGYAANVYARHFPTGSYLDISNGVGTVSIGSDTQFTVTTSYAFATSTTTPVYCLAPVKRSSAYPKTKTINRNKMVKIDCSNNTGGSTGPWDLGIVDVAYMNNVYVGYNAVSNNTAGYANTNPDRLNWFFLDKGQRDDEYSTAKLYINPSYKAQINSTAKFLVYLDHYTQSSSAGAGFFTVDSYPIANTANATYITYGDIPQYGSIDLRDIVDFRPYRLNTANNVANTNPANTYVTINPAAANASYDIPATGIYLPEPDSNFTTAMEYYLSRFDLVTLNPKGDLIIKSGVPSINPSAPYNENDSITLAVAFVPAFPSLTTREGELNGRKDITNKVEIRSARRYTMRDIGALEQRIKNLEYYTVLSTLEKTATDMSVTDSNGLDRFKNGIFVDPFNSSAIGNVADIEHKIAIDVQNSLARPKFTTHPIDIAFNNDASNTASSGTVPKFTKKGSLLSLPYTASVAISQLYATKGRNCTDALYKFNGKLKLYPTTDYFKDEKTAPNVNINMDLSAPLEAYANSPAGTQYGDWRTTASSLDSTRIDDAAVTDAMKASALRGAIEGGTDDLKNFGAGQAAWSVGVGNYDVASAQGWRSRDYVNAPGRAGWGYFKETQTTTSEQIVKKMKVNTVSTENTLGNYVVDYSVMPYMRSRIVAFVATGLKPNTRMYPFFDDTNIAQYCASGVLSGLNDFESGKENNYVTQKGSFGGALITDDAGFVCGVYKIPDTTFRTGDRRFLLANVDNLVTGADEKNSEASATYSASNISVTKETVTLTTKTPTVSFEDTTVTKTVTNDTGRVAHQYEDPISESFFVETAGTDTGFSCSKIGVYFKQKDAVLGVSCYIMELRAGVPDITTIVAYAHLNSSDVAVDGTYGQTETIFEFDEPVYLTASKQYAFMIQPDNNSPDYVIWVAEVGGVDVFTGQYVSSNPYVGTMFLSSNRVTWTAYQKEDIKFNVYKSEYGSLSGVHLIFENENDDFLTVDGFTRRLSDVPVEVGDVVYTVNSSSSALLTDKTLYPYGVVQYIDEDNNKMYLDSSTGGFSNTTNPQLKIYRVADRANTAQLIEGNRVATANIVTVDNLAYNAIVPKFSIMEPSTATVSYTFKGVDGSHVQDTTGVVVKNNEEYEFYDKTRYVYSYSNEKGLATKSLTYDISLTSTSSFISPVIDLSRKSTLCIENLINNDNTNEHLKTGNAIAKYVGKNVTLTQPAEDLNVWVTAYRPLGTEVEVYCKFLNDSDNQSFIDKHWTKMAFSPGAGDAYSTLADLKNYIEYSYVMPSSNATAYGAFANTSSITLSGTTGTVNAVSGSAVLAGTGTLFTTELAPSSKIRIFNGTTYTDRNIVSIANSTSMTVDVGLTFSNTTSSIQLFGSGGNMGIVEYTSSAGNRYVGFKQFAVKIVLLSNNAAVVPRLDDVRAIALQV